MNFIDPSGHFQCESSDGGCSSESQVTATWVAGDEKRQKIIDLLELKHKVKRSKKQACSGSNQSVLCLPASASGVNTSINLGFRYTQSQSHGFSYDVDGFVNGLETELMAFDLVSAMQGAADHVKPAYRQLKAAVPLTALEMGISGALQTIQDLDNHLNLGQRAARSITVSLETGITDVISDAYGAAGYTQGGGVGYVAAAFAANITMDNNWDHLNAQAFPILHLGDYP